MPFTLIQERRIEEIDSIARLYRHEPTGARVLSLINQDENKVFGVSFRTPPARSDGVAHILEHSVLCGSEKYPVKEPFVELMKGSLNTFLNALTYPDKTVYPVASANLKDFRNLIDVYLDAVFKPRLTEDTFRQEGWHYEVDPDSGDLSYKGVVFNEMKGAYSDPDDLHDDLCRRSLFPDTPYGLDSGGDPSVIPLLTYEEFKAFHGKYYHPSNSFIYFYGDDDPQERLAIIERRLAGYGRLAIDSLPGMQEPFGEPRSITSVYEGKEPKSWIAVNWALSEHGNPELALGLSILSHILTATPASPLRKALIDSGLGEDLAGFGLEDSIRQTAFSIGLKGVSPDKTGEVEGLVFSTLERLAEEGLDPETVAASLNTIEFALREKNTGRFPKGLAMMLEALNEWLYDEDPFSALSFEESLAAIKKGSADGGTYFESLIREWLLKNPHRTTVTLLPDPSANQKREALERERLAAAKASMSETELEEAARSAERLARLQETPDSPEALATIPALSIDDIPSDAQVLPSEEGRVGPCKVLFHDLPTSSILYLDLAFPLQNVEDRLLPYVGLLGRLLLEMGSDKRDYVALSQEIGKHTGGIGASAFSTTGWSGEAASYFIVRGKCLIPKTETMLSLMSEALMHAKLDDRERFRQILLEEKAQAEASLVPSGHRLVGLRLRSRLSEADYINERMGGVSYLFFLRELAARVEGDWDSVRADLEAVRDAVIASGGAVFNVTLDAGGYAEIKTALESFAMGLPRGAAGASQTPAARRVGMDAKPRHEALTAPSQVNFVGRAFRLGRADGARRGGFLVAKKYMDTTYLWEKVRVQGGAYGGFSSYDPNSGIFLFLSYRDPNLEKTLETFAAVPEFLDDVAVSGDELTKSIIGTIGDVDAYLLPDAKGFTSLMHHLTGYSYEDRQSVRKGILGTSERSFRELAAALREGLAASLTASLSSPQRAGALPESIRDQASFIELI